MIDTSLNHYPIKWSLTVDSGEWNSRCPWNRNATRKPTEIRFQKMIATMTADKVCQVTNYAMVLSYQPPVVTFSDRPSIDSIKNEETKRARERKNKRRNRNRRQISDIHTRTDFSPHVQWGFTHDQLMIRTINKHTALFLFFLSFTHDWFDHPHIIIIFHRKLTRFHKLYREMLNTWFVVYLNQWTGYSSEWTKSCLKYMHVVRQ